MTAAVGAVLAAVTVLLGRLLLNRPPLAAVIDSIEPPPAGLRVSPQTYDTGPEREAVWGLAAGGD